MLARVNWARGGRAALAVLAACALLGVNASSALAFRVSGFSVRGRPSGLVYHVVICGLQGVRTKVIAAIRPARGGTILHHAWHVTPHFACTGFTLRANDPFPAGEYVTTLGVFASGGHVILAAKPFHNI
jgi:hypothetical protein